jgi:hypothetical protein
MYRRHAQTSSPPTSRRDGFSSAPLASGVGRPDLKIVPSHQSNQLSRDAYDASHHQRSIYSEEPNDGGCFLDGVGFLSPGFADGGAAPRSQFRKNPNDGGSPVGENGASAAGPAHTWESQFRIPNDGGRYRKNPNDGGYSTWESQFRIPNDGGRYRKNPNDGGCSQFSSPNDEGFFDGGNGCAAVTGADTHLAFTI